MIGDGFRTVMALLALIAAVFIGAMLAKPEPVWTLRVRCQHVNRQVADVITRPYQDADGWTESWACTERGWVRVAATQEK